MSRELASEIEVQPFRRLLSLTWVEHFLPNIFMSFVREFISFDLLILPSEPSADMRDQGRGPSRYSKTLRRSIDLFWATTRRRPNRFLSAFIMTSLPEILTLESVNDVKLASFNSWMDHEKELQNLEVSSEKRYHSFLQGPRNDILRGGWLGAITWPSEKVIFNISETVVNTSYFNDYSEITKHWLY